MKAEVAFANAPSSVVEAPQKPEVFPTVRQFFALLLIYFTLQIILRVWISSSLDLDESEQLVLTQKLSLGYGSQPPLYTWIQFLFFKVFGLSVFAVSLMKNILLLGSCLFTYLSTRFITRNHFCGVAAAASLLFIPQFVWESQRDLTHSVMSATFACGMLYCFLRLSAAPSIAKYALFGFCAGLGVLTKYNFTLALFGLTLGALSVPKFRTVVLDRRMALAILIAAVVVLPNALWAWEHRNLALHEVGKLNIQESAPRLTTIAAGLKALAQSTINFFAAFAVILAVIFWKRPRSPVPSEKGEHAALLARTLGISYGLIVLAIVIFRVSEVHDRWMQPILFVSPVLAIACLKPRLSHSRLKWMLALMVLAMASATVILHGRVLLAQRLHRTQPWNRPYDELAKRLKVPLMPCGLIVTDTTLLAGNLRMNFPDKTFTTPQLAGILTEPINTHVALVWDAGGDPLAKVSARHPFRDWPPPDNIADFAHRAGINLDQARAEYVSATFKYYTGREMKLGLLSGPVSMTDH